MPCSVPKDHGGRLCPINVGLGTWRLGIPGELPVMLGTPGMIGVGAGRDTTSGSSQVIAGIPDDRAPRLRLRDLAIGTALLDSSEDRKSVA